MTKARLMIVEDEGIVALDLQSSLERLGYDVPVVVPSGEEAIEQAGQERPDLALMDIMLEGDLDGISTAATLKDRFNIPVVYLTAYADDDTLRRASITEPYGYLLKPFEERELHTTIEIALYKHRAEEALHCRDAILSAVSFAAEQFLIAPSWEDCIQAVVEQLGQAANVSRTYIVESSPAEDGVRTARRRCEWTAPGVEPQLGSPELQELLLQPAESTPWVELLGHGQPIHGHVRELAPSEQYVLTAQSIQSVLVVPIFVGQTWWGYIGFDECFQERDWSSAEIDALKTAAGTLGAAIQRTRLHRQIQQHSAEMSSLYEVSTAGMTSIRLDEILSRTTAALQKALPAESITILLVNSETHELVPRISTFSHETGGVPPLADETTSELSVPLQVGWRIIGAIVLKSQRGAMFSADNERLLSILAGHLAAVIENAYLVEGLEAEVIARMAEIVAEKEKSETILRNIGDAICMLDLQMRVRYINPAFTTLTGYSADEIVGQPLDQLLAEAWPEPERRSWQHTVGRGEGWKGELVLRRKDGLSYEAAAVMAPIADAERRLAGYVFSHQDISRIKALERARSQFMANVSHELRTPVSILKLCTSMLGESRQSDKEEHYLELMEKQVDRLLHLIQDVLEMAELDSGQVVTRWEPLSPASLIRDATVRYHDQAMEAGVALSTRPVASDLPVAEGDRGRLFQALCELVENALIFTPAGGQASVEVNSAEKEGQPWLTIAVRDTGPGISPQEQRRIFDRLYRGSLAESGQIPGTGLGLSIAQEILRAHGGAVTVESKLGEGSTFTLWLRGRS